MGDFRTHPNLMKTYANWREDQLAGIDWLECNPIQIYRDFDSRYAIMSDIFSQSYYGCCFRAEYTYKGQTMVGEFGILEDGNLCLINIGGINMNFDGDIQYKPSPYDEILVPSEAFGRKVTEIGSSINPHSWLDGTYGIVSGLRNFSKVIIPEGIRRIHEGAFDDNGNFDGYTISIPSTVETISEQVFTNSSCTHTLEISPENEYFALINNILYDKKNRRLVRNLTNSLLEPYSVNIPEGIRRIDKGAFDDCGNLESIIFPSTLKEIPEKLFYCRPGFKKVTIKEGTEVINDGALVSFDLEEVSLPASISYIDKYAFPDGSWDASKVKFHVVRHSYAADFVIKIGGNRIYSDEMDWLNG